MGLFANGNVASGTQLPAANNVNPPVVYSGGVGITQGVCLCTGAATDNDIAATGTPGRGIGVQGPNNGELGNNAGEIQVQFFSDGTIDQDFNEHVFGNSIPGSSSDPTVLQFQINLQKPGLLWLRYVFGSDEYPFFINQQFNDSYAILIRKDACQNTDFANIATFKSPDNPNPKPFTLQDIRLCGPPIFKENQLAPAPSVFVSPVSPHAIDDSPGEAPHLYDPNIPYYDHEFGGFTKPLVSETSNVLSPGDYTIKIVIHDVADGQIDSALFIEEDSLVLFDFLVADFDRDGDIDGRDFLIWQRNVWATNATFTQGDANGDCVVDTQDLVIWGNNYGQSGGNAKYCADFDRDGDVDGRDLLIWQRHVGMEHCASRFEGDADGDGDVDSCDLSIWQAEFNSGPLAVCACEGDEMAMVEKSESSDEFDPADANQDGKVDKTDIDQLIEFWTSMEK